MLLTVSYTHLDVYKRQQYDMAPYDWDKIAKQVMGVYEGLLK